VYLCRLLITSEVQVSNDDDEGVSKTESQGRLKAK
jgi:hypothetical protein